MKKILLSLLSAVAICVLLTGCVDMMKAKPLAEAQIESFHLLFNDGKYSEIYAAADSRFQQATAEQKLTDLLTAVHRKLGTVKSSSNQNWNINSYNGSTRIVMIENTTFDQGSATETFTYIISNSQASLLSYNIGSSDLIEK
jgi:hypothetical protein